MSCSARALTRRSDGERAELVVLVDGEGVGDVEWPAVDDAREVVFAAEVCEQLAHLLGASGVHHVAPVDLGELTDGSMDDRADAVAAAAQFFGDGCADAGVVGQDRARTNRSAVLSRSSLAAESSSSMAHH